MFKNKKLKFRVIKKKDLDLLINLRNETSTWEMLKNIDLIDHSKQINWFDKLKNDPSRKYFVIENLKNLFLGVIRMDEIDYINRTIRIGCDIIKKERGKGYGSQTFDLILDYCFNYLNMNKAWLEVVTYNKSALKLYKRKGFVKEGLIRKNIYRNGKYFDSILMGILKSEYKKTLR